MGINSLEITRPLIEVPLGEQATMRDVRGSVLSDAALPYGDVTHHVRELSTLTAWKTLRAVLFDWTFIVASFAVAMVLRHPVTWLIAAVVIASRQHALLILMHDASHYRLLSNRKWNDRISNWLLAWPLLVSTEGYRNNHLAHHRHLNTDDDPDWVRKQGHADWTFPKTRWALAMILVRELFGGGFIGAMRSIVDLSGRKLRKVSKDQKSPRFERLAYYAALAAAITLGGLWVPVLLLWFLPAFTILTVILRIRSIAEHFGVEGEDQLDSSRNTHPRMWERLLLTPHNSGLHLDHHLYPSVPFYNLPTLHALLKSNPRYAHQAHQSDSLFGASPSSCLSEVTAKE